MQAVHVLSAILVLQAQALQLGARVESQAERTQMAFCQQVEALVQPSEAPPVEVGPPVPEDAPLSAWDPDTHDAVLEASKCRALLLEVVRRAAHDWVLYRNTRKPERAYALDAYVWLFEEGPAEDGKPAHPNWELRQREGDPLLAFLTICELLDLDPETVRRRIRAMTIRDIMTAGRPAERRKVSKSEGVEDYSSPRELDIVSLDDPSFDSSYESHFAVAAGY